MSMSRRRSARKGRTSAERTSYEAAREGGLYSSSCSYVTMQRQPSRRPFASHQLIRRQLLIEQLARAFDARHRQAFGIEQPDLHEHGSLIPIDMLVIQLVAAKAHDSEHRPFE